MKNPIRQHRSAFTLIEMIAVMTIIAILASIVIGGTTYVRQKQQMQTAKVQIALLSKAIDDYHLDNGDYPPTTDVTSATAPTGTGTSSVLFDYLFWDSDRDGVGGLTDEDQKIYLPELDTENKKQKWTSGTASANTTIKDPWGNEYCYRSKVAEGGAANSSTLNPDFDLWSMGKDGKTNPSNPSHQDNKDDIKNF